MQSPPTVSEDHADRQAALYEAIRFQISQSFFSRTRIDEEELLHVLFIKLVDRFLPPFGSEKLTELLRQEIRHAIRDFKLARRPMLDIDEVAPDEGPSYDERKNGDEAEFEAMFERFCASREEPERSIYGKYRVLPRNELAELAGIPRAEVSRFLKTMPDKFEDFLKKNRE